MTATQQNFGNLNLGANNAVAASGPDDGWGDEDDNWDDADDAGVNDEFADALTSPPQSGNSSLGFGVAANDDPFASIGVSTSNKQMAPRKAGSGLVVPKKKATPIVQKAAKPATKLSMDDDDIADGWDDF
eukprot:CAMPEP_0198122142 /NCGR_PEP_ID=MMETSP1442-20131203/34016_1 /TAXON_ID= /ORGANISM="Craspedostauros australis, Strain CCMP3328" /LENGTH=129 /DNA_ID=CAMNT_0043781103 /DNA_START=44 /DNA_END=433 /DNA_ORIENTATION=+